MKTLILSIVIIFSTSLVVISQSCPTTANCGCSNKSKAVCPTDPCCQWIVGTGCKCLNSPTKTDNLQSDSIRIFPNPAGDFLNIQLNSNNSILVEIIAMDGVIVFSKKLFDTKNNNQIKLIGIDKGLYVCRLNDGNRVYSLKLWKI